MSFDNFGVGHIKTQIARRAQARRLAENLSRKTLSVRSGVPESTIKRFEAEGEASLDALLKISLALGCLESFESLFPAAQPDTIQAVQPASRKRGRA